MRMHGRRRAVALLSAVAGVLAVSGAAAATAGPSGNVIEGTSVNYITRLGTTSCSPITKTISGTLVGMDQRDVNAEISMDLQDSAGKALDGQGCHNDPGYGVRIHLNYFLPQTGEDFATAAADTRAPVTSWSAQIPADVARVFLEVYPKQASSQPRFGISNRSHYGMTEDPRVSTTGPDSFANLALPVTDCTSPYGTGTVVGKFYYRGKVVKGLRASAFSEANAPRDPATSGPLGMGIWTGNSTSYKITMLAASNGKGQPYIIFGTLKSGQTKRFLMYNGVTHKQSAGVHSCRTTTFNLTF